MANIILYNGNEEKEVSYKSNEWYELLKKGWTSWKQDVPKKKIGRPSKTNDS